MKILHIVPSYWPAFEFGGPIQSVHYLNKFLVREGIEVVVYTTNAGLENDKSIFLKKEIILDGVKIFYFPYFGYRHYNFSPILFWQLGRHLKDFDLVHITSVWNFPVWAAAFWSKIYKKPYLISPRGSLMEEPLEKKSSLKKKIYLWFLAKRYLAGAKTIHFTTELEKEEYLGAGLAFKKAIIIPNGFEFESCGLKHHKVNFKEKFGIPKDKKIILFLSRLNWKKGLDTLIPSFAEVLKRKPRAVLILAGPSEDNYKKQIEQKIKNYKLEIGENVFFTGLLLDDDKTAAFRESEIFVLPSYSENFGIAAVEAMAYGLPVIITKNVGLAPIVVKGGAGLVINKDIKQLSDSILKILNNPSLAQKMSLAGRRIIKKEFAWPEIAKKFSKEYRGLINFNS